MFYEPTTNNTYKTTDDIRRAYPNTSFGDLSTTEELKSAGFYIPTMEIPDHDPDFEEAVPGDIVLEEGKYKLTYTVVEKSMTPERKTQLYVQRFDRILTDLFMRTANDKRYDSHITCALRAGYPGPFQEEGIAFASWMDSCNALAYQLMAEVIADTKPMPANAEEFLSNFPPMVWPTA